MKVLFLDVDGVLNMCNSGGIKSLNRKRLKFLQEIVETTSCKIVLSSTWRLHPEFYKLLAKNLGYRGMEIYSSTSNYATKVVYNNDKQHLRGYEIASWVNNHREDLESYVIVDDHDEMLPFQQSRFH